MRTCLVVLLLAGCATQPQYVWVKQGANEADFNTDMGYCRAQAFSVPGAMNNLLQVAAVQSSCMSGRGWYTEEKR